MGQDVPQKNWMTRFCSKLWSMQEIAYNDKFKLFMQTKLSNPHYPPEIQASAWWTGTKRRWFLTHIHSQRGYNYNYISLISCHFIHHKCLSCTTTIMTTMIIFDFVFLFPPYIPMIPHVSQNMAGRRSCPQRAPASGRVYRDQLHCHRAGTGGETPTLTARFLTEAGEQPITQFPCWKSRK